MSDQTVSFILVLTITITIITTIFIVGAKVSKTGMQRQAVELGHAEYNSTTAEFQWRTCR